jgi:hypothetical protein
MQESARKSDVDPDGPTVGATDGGLDNTETGVGGERRSLGLGEVSLKGCNRSLRKNTVPASIFGSLRCM